MSSTSMLVIAAAIYFGVGAAALIVLALYAWSQGGGVSWADAVRALLAWPYFAWVLLRQR